MCDVPKTRLELKALKGNMDSIKFLPLIFVNSLHSYQKTQLFQREFRH